MLGLLTQRVETLYVFDEHGHIVGSNEWDSRPGPRFHVMLTRHGAIARFRGDVPDHVVRRLEAICRSEVLTEPGPGLPAGRDELLGALAAHAPVERVSCGPAYRLANSVRLEGARTVAINNGNAHLLKYSFPDWLADVPHRRPFVAVVEDDRAVAICASVRISATVHCAGVETHADHRRRGHALRVVAGWARAVRAAGVTPFYSTSWDNVASQRVASRLGFEMVGVDFHAA